ncbi:hypothetical protein [Deferrisoma camini]|uniref:hypothetical protein n=1 Tax=Deferrisoma camini TaxID=1035120 RepID=UPI00046CFC08|nr:hypothetical protein [Deferrisoma camini]
MIALRRGLWLLLLAAVLTTPSWAATIRPGEVRVVEGRVSAVDVSYRTVVLEVPTPKGDLTVGVTLDEAVRPRIDGREIRLSEVEIGTTARLKYTRRDDRLVGLDLVVRR